MVTANHDSPWQRSCAPYGSTLETFPDLAAGDLLLVEGAYGLAALESSYLLLLVLVATRRAYKAR